MQMQPHLNKKAPTLADMFVEYNRACNQCKLHKNKHYQSQKEMINLSQILISSKIRTRSYLKESRFYEKQKAKMYYKINRRLQLDELKRVVQTYQENEQDVQVADKISSNRLSIERLNKLPEDMVKEILSFIPISVKILLIEDRYSPFKLINQLKSHATSELFKSICSNPITFPVLTLEEASLYNFRNMTEKKLQITNIIYKLKEHLPEYALQILRMISMIIPPKPTRVYVKKEVNILKL